MPIAMIQTTAAAAADTAADPAQRHPALAFVILWSASQPHRVGEVAFIPAFEERFVGRGDDAIDKFARFARQRPGEAPATDPRAGLLTGDSMSRRQAAVRAGATSIEIERVGRSAMLVNGVECPRAVLKPGDTVMFKGELLLLCTWRPTMLPAACGPCEGHVYGEADSAGIVGESGVVWTLRAEVARAAMSDDHVLVLGESGTGKELVAGALHRWSKRANGPFIPFNAADLSPSLIAAELNGHPANYPNPGMPARKGLLGDSDHGTLFIDEIGDLPLDAQAALLRALDSGQYRPVGETKPRKVDSRFVGATNKGGSVFRADFPARFPVRIYLPPLRERREDVPLLIRQWLLQRAQKFPALERFIRTGPSGRPEPQVSARLVDYLVRQPLPLNVRELHGVLLKAVDVDVSPRDVVRLPTFDPTHVPPSPRPSGEEEAKSNVDEEEEANGYMRPGSPSKAELVACLDRERGNVSRVGRALGLHRNAVYRLMESYGIKKGGCV